MLTEDQVISAIKELYNGRPVPYSKIKKKLKVDGEEVTWILEKLEREGKLRIVDVGVGKSFEPVEGVDKIDLVLAEVRQLREEVRKLQELYSDRKRVSESAFDEIYEKVKDNLGYAHLSAIRIEMGLSKEEFYSKLSKHVEEHYDLIAGGDEGFVRKGSVYGIVRRRSR